MHPKLGHFPFRHNSEIINIYRAFDILIFIISVDSFAEQERAWIPIVTGLILYCRNYRLLTFNVMAFSWQKGVDI
jgi:hypothetical protein